MHNLVVMFWNWNVIFFWVVTLDLCMCMSKNIKSNALQGCHLDACESCANENWPHIRNLKFTLNWISNISQYTLIIVIRVKLHCLIPSLLICSSLKHQYYIRVGVWNEHFAIFPSHLCPWIVLDKLQVGVLASSSIVKPFTWTISNFKHNIARVYNIPNIKHVWFNMVWE